MADNGGLKNRWDIPCGFESRPRYHLYFTKGVITLALTTASREQLAQLLHDILKEDTEGLDAIYEDYIVERIGVEGFIVLREFKLLTTCGSMNGRNLYTLS